MFAKSVLFIGTCLSRRKGVKKIKQTTTLSLLAIYFLVTVFWDVFRLQKPKMVSVHGFVVSKNSSEAIAIDGT